MEMAEPTQTDLRGLTDGLPAMSRLKRLILSILFLPAACGVSDRVSESSRQELPVSEDALVIDTRGRHGGVLRYGLLGEPSTFNYVLAQQESRAKLVTHLTTGTLLEFDPVAQEVTPGVCREWEFSEDGRVATLFLRKGVRFSDGAALTSADVVFSFEKILQEESTNTLRDSLLFEGKPVAVSALDPHTVEVRFAGTRAASEYLLSTVPVLPRHRFPDATKKIEEYWNLDTPPGDMAGLGPFMVAAHEAGERLVLRFNPHYWKIDAERRRLPYLDELILYFIQERDTQLLRFQAQELDLLDQSLRAEDFAQLRQSNARIEDVGPSNNLTFFWFNLNTGVNPESRRPYVPSPQKDWFANLEFRQAVSTAISRDDIVRNVYFGHATPAWTLIPATFRKWYPPNVTRYPHDSGRARQLLSGAGFSWRPTETGEVLVDSGGRAVEFEIITPGDGILGKIAAIIQQDLAALGMRVRIRQEEFRSVISRVMRSRDYDAAIMNVGWPLEPSDSMNVLVSSNPMHVWHPSQKEPATKWEKRIDELMLSQVATLDPQVRQRMYREVLRIVADQVPVVPLVHRDALIAGGRRLKNLRPISMFPHGLWNTWELWMDEE